MPSKSWYDSTTRRPPECDTRSSKRARDSMSTYSAPSASASARMRRRSSSAPLKRPPSHSGRHVTMTGRRRPASAPATSGSLTESRRSSTRSASATSSRRRRSSAIVGAVTVTHRRGFGHTNTKKASSPVRLKRLGNSRSRGGRSGQGDCPFSRAPIPPPGGRRPTRAHAEPERAKRRKNRHSTNHRAPNDTKGGRMCQPRTAISP